MTFGQTIIQARRRAGVSQKELAFLVKKEDGTAISPQYLNDIEHDRRNPSSEFLIERFASVLDVAPEVLYFAAGRLPSRMTRGAVQEKHVVAAFEAFQRALRGRR